MRSRYFATTLIVGAVVLSACSGRDNDESTFTGTYTSSLDFGAGGASFGLEIVDEVAEVTGSVIAGTDVGPARSTGTGTYTGLYEVAYYTGTDTILNDDGDITLDADFDAGTLTGTSGDLTVTGAITGNTLGGSVTFMGMNGDLSGGAIGEDLATGYFGGIDGTDAFAGVFLTSPPAP